MLVIPAFFIVFACCKRHHPKPKMVISWMADREKNCILHRKAMEPVNEPKPRKKQIGYLYLRTKRV